MKSYMRVIFGLTVVAAIVFIYWHLSTAAMQVVLATMHTPKPYQPRDYRPDIRHCLEPDRDTWDCIRGAE